MKRAPLSDLGPQDVLSRSGKAGAKKATKTSQAPDDRAKDVPGPPPPDMSALHAPVGRGWGRSQWREWVKASDEFSRALMNDFGSHDDDDDGDDKLEQWVLQRTDAIEWAAPDEMVLWVTRQPASSPGGEDHQEDDDRSSCRMLLKRTEEPDISLRSLIDRACNALGITDRDAFSWQLATNTESAQGLFSTRDVMLGTDVPAWEAFALWDPRLDHCWLEETLYGRKLVAVPKTPPAPPASAPSFSEMKRPPPEATDSVDTWEEWTRDHGGFCTAQHWCQVRRAVEWRCPELVALSLEGIWHSHTVEAKADEPLAVALEAFCAAAPPEARQLSPADFLLQQDEDDFLDSYTTCARSLYHGNEKGPGIKLRVVHRSPERAKQDRRAKFGSCPAGYMLFSGSAYLVQETEKEWLLSRAEGVPMFNRVIEEAMVLHQGTDFCRGYNPIESWWRMTSALRKVLASVARQPRGGWDATSAEVALDRFTGFLLSTVRNEEWRNDARGKIMMWDPKCRQETKAIMQKMDTAACKVIKAAKGEASHGPAGERLGIPAGLEQLKRLLLKLQDEYSGFFQGQSKAFAKALVMLE